mgnify:CR=1 FL=1
MKLKTELGGRSIEGSFTTKWEKVEKAFYSAIGKEQNISRLSSFFEKDHSNFNSKPMELIIHDVDSHVDRTLGRSEKTFKDRKGRTHSDFTFLLKTKYSIIFQIALNLPPTVKLMKDYILQTVANILEDIELLVDISEFQENLTTEFEKRGNIGDYKTVLIPAYKKSLTVNEAKVIPDKKKDKKENNIEWVKINETSTKNILEELHKRGIQSVFVEGGSRTLQYFIIDNVWDEARVVVGQKYFKEGYKAPIINKVPIKSIPFGKDMIHYYKRK